MGSPQTVAGIPDPDDARLIAKERDVQSHSASLRKELSLPNLVFTQVLAIMGLSWIGAAGKLGSSHLAFWLAAIALFYIPSALVVIHLNNEMPLEGGLYQWAKIRIGEFAGFLVALNIWFYSVVFISEMGLLLANNLAYSIGPAGAWIADNKPLIATANALVIIMLVIVAIAGLAIGKWVHGFAGFMILFLFAAMACFAIPHWFHGAAAHPPLALTMPALTLFNLNLLGKMGFGAMGGFDTVAIFSGECQGKDVAATVRRSVWIATPLIAGAFVFGTACVLVFVKPGDIDLISPVTQVLNRGLQAIGFSGSATAVVGTLIMMTLIGQALLSFNSCARLPLVAGWDRLLPEWVTTLHPKYRTPTGSILAIAAISLAIALLTSMGAGNQEAYQILQNANGVAYGVAYAAMFAIPIFASGERARWPLRLAALSGLAMTLLYVVTALFPIVDVPSPLTFALKVGGVVAGLNLAGALFYLRAKTRRELRVKVTALS